MIAKCGQCGSKFRVEEESGQDFRQYACINCGKINRVSIQRMAAREVELVDQKR